MVGSVGWRSRFVANAVEVVARYGDRIPAFEVLLGSNQRGPDGAVVRLTDKAGEPDKLRLEVCFDAIRWLPVGGT